MENFNPTTFEILNFSYCGVEGNCLAIAQHFVKNYLNNTYEPLCHKHFVQAYECPELSTGEF